MNCNAIISVSIVQYDIQSQCYSFKKSKLNVVRCCGFQYFKSTNISIDCITIHIRTAMYISSNKNKVLRSKVIGFDSECYSCYTVIPAPKNNTLFLFEDIYIAVLI